MSEATKNSPSPRPMTTGGPSRTAMIVSGSSAEMIESAKMPRSSRTARRTAFSKESSVFDVLLDQVRDDLGVGLGDEAVVARAQPVFELEVVLDDAVVNDDDAARAVAVRVRVLLGRPPVRRPARVADAVGAVERLQPDRLFEIAQLPFGAAHLELVRLVHDRDPAES